MTAESMERLLALGLSNAALATALALLAFAVSKLSRRPPLAHVLWLLVLLKLVSPPLLEIPSSSVAELQGLATRLAPVAGDVGSPSFSPAIDPALELATLEVSTFEVPTFEVPAFEMASLKVLEEPGFAPEIPVGIVEPATAWAATPSSSWIAPAALSLWLGGALLVLVATAVRIVRFDRLLRWSRPAPAPLAMAVSEVARQLGLRVAPRALVVDARIPPLLWAWRGETRVIFPAGLLAVLGEGQLRTLVAHELAHLRRRDHWLRWLELAVVALYWWLPVAWWARRELRRAEEECCDAWVQRELTASVREYARALLKTIDFLSGVQVKLPRTASALGEARFLRRRFQMILERSLNHRLSAPLRALWIAACLAVLPWTASGALGQKSDDAREPDPAPGSGEGKTDATTDKAPPGASIEHRLSKMESQLAELMAEIRSLRKQGPSKEARAFHLWEDAIESRDPETGKVLWKSKLKGSPHVEVNQEGKQVVIRDHKGRRTTILDSDSGKVISTTEESPDGHDIVKKELLFDPKGKLHAEKKLVPEEKRHKEKEASDDEASAKERRVHDDLFKVKADVARIEAERAKLLEHLQELEAQRAAIKAQLKKLEHQYDNVPAR